MAYEPTVSEVIKARAYRHEVAFSYDAPQKYLHQELLDGWTLPTMTPNDLKECIESLESIKGKNKYQVRLIKVLEMELEVRETETEEQEEPIKNLVFTIDGKEITIPSSTFIPTGKYTSKTQKSRDRRVLGRY